MYIDEPNGEPYRNPIKKFELEPNLIIAELEFNPEPCDIVLQFCNKFFELSPDP